MKEQRWKEDVLVKLYNTNPLIKAYVWNSGKYRQDNLPETASELDCHDQTIIIKVCNAYQLSLDLWTYPYFLWSTGQMNKAAVNSAIVEFTDKRPLAL